MLCLLHVSLKNKKKTDIFTKKNIKDQSQSFSKVL